MFSMPAWIRTRFDQFGKQMVRSAIAARGSVETDAEVPADTRRIDLWFMPDPACEPVPGYLGLLGRITAGPSTLEFFHNTPSGDDLADCLIKHGQFRHNTESAIIRRGPSRGGHAGRGSPESRRHSLALSGKVGLARSTARCDRRKERAHALHDAVGRPGASQLSPEDQRSAFSGSLR
jgi:hypothetical protein